MKVLKQRKGRKGMLGVLAVLLTVFALGTPNTDAAGLLIADGGFGGVLEIKEHHVNVTINNSIAVTRVTQIFKNTEKRQVEALYTFPVPKGASVANFSMWINGKEMIGEVLEKKRAREIYNSYKQKRRDPGLLEQVDYKTFEMRIFPINAEAEQKVEIVYYQELNIDNDTGTYVYPLATVTRRGIDSRTTGTFAMNVEIKSAIPITEVNSPSHESAFVVAQHSEEYHLASLETKGGSLASDIVVNYKLSRPKTGIDMIASNNKREDGYFCMTMSVGKDLEKLDGGMDYVFLLDISGSMKDDSKLIISRNSLDAFIDELGEKDEFEVMTFNIRPNAVFNKLETASDQTKSSAKQFMASQQAKGGTTLAPAMTAAYKYSNPDRTLNVIIVSDGMTEQSERRELLSLIQSRPRNARVFCIGIGNEVNRPLLEQLAEDSGGLAAFVSHGDNFKRQAKGFRRKLMHPAASDLVLDIQGVSVYDIEPRTLPNLYHGSPVRIYGRYKGSGEGKVTINANVLGREFKQAVTMDFPETDTTNPEIERMWAWKRVDQLLKQADRTGSRDNVLNEIVQLGETYSIVTEYTSFLVLENDAEYKRWKIDRRNVARLSRDRDAQALRKEKLDTIRNKAVANIGPATEEKAKPQAQAPQARPTQMARNTSTPTPSRPSRSRNLDFNFGTGTGPVGPLFIGLIMLLARKRKKNS